MEIGLYSFADVNPDARELNANTNTRMKELMEEIKFADEVILTASLARLTRDASRWTIKHEFLSSDQKVLATLTVDGAWIDTRVRKLLSPIPDIVMEVFNAIPKSEGFVIS